MDIAWVLLVPAYLLGTFPSAIIVGRRKGRDPTREGSGNPGASNTLRTMGRRAAALVLLADLAKGALAAAAGLASGNRAVALGCGLAAVIGHVAPLGRPRRGGKGVATAAGMTLVLLPLAALALALVWITTAKLSGTASVASLAAAAGLPLAAALAGRPMGEILAFALCGLLVALRHRSNIDRLVRGEERTMGRDRAGGPT